MDPRQVAPVEIQTTVLYHCDCRMRVVSSPVENCMRTRYLRCDVCGATAKSIEFIPQGPAAQIVREERRH